MVRGAGQFLLILSRLMNFKEIRASVYHAVDVCYTANEPDQIAGGNPKNVTGMGAKYVNSSIGSLSRQWECPSCYTHHERDTNTAKNILERGLQAAMQS